MKILFFILILNITVFCQSFRIDGTPQLFAPGIVCAENSEVKITFSKDQKLVLWGAVNREGGKGDLDIWQALKSDTGWSNPQPLFFNTKDKEFDPMFSADGKILYFFSNRPGGVGGDDIYYAKYDSLIQSLSEPVNMGKQFNTKGDEWGPTESFNGKKFLYCTDGFEGKGKHDIFVCNKSGNSWSKPKVINEINSSEDDFDPIFLMDNETILFTRKHNEEEAYLYITFLNSGVYSEPQKLGNDINISGTWNFGSSLDPIDPSYIYYSTHNEKNSQGKLDIFKVKYILNAK